MNFFKIMIMQIIVSMLLMFSVLNAANSPFEVYFQQEEREKIFLSLLQVEKTRQIEIKHLEEKERARKKSARLKREKELYLAQELKKRIEREKEYSRIREERIFKEKEAEAREKIARKKQEKSRKEAREKRRVAKRKRLLAKIDISKQKMLVYQGGELIHTWKVSTGKQGYRTPRGNYRPTIVKKMHYSRKYNNSPMPYSVFFKGGYAIHGTKSVWRLGSRASHGCVRLHTANAKKFYKLIKSNGKNNTKIKIIN